jgi:hypothetical protein
MTRWTPFVLLASLLMAACGDSPTAPDDTATTTTTVSPTVFEGTLDVKGARFYSFSVSQSGSLTAHLASLTLVGHREVLAVPVRLGVGVPKGEGCAVTEFVDASPALVTQLTTTLAAGIYCMNISDIGALPDAAVFSIRFLHS